jgi:hypothetical protein
MQEGASTLASEKRCKTDSILDFNCFEDQASDDMKEEVR